MKSLPDDDAVLLATLRAAGREAVERKRLLGQYAVIWRGGQPAFVGPNPPVAPNCYPPLGEGTWPTGVDEPSAGSTP